MTYERARLVEQRLHRAVALIESEPVDARLLATKLEVSRPTVHRILAELRRRGCTIRSTHDESGWRYELIGKSDEYRVRSSP